MYSGKKINLTLVNELKLDIKLIYIERDSLAWSACISDVSVHNFSQFFKSLDENGERPIRLIYRNWMNRRLGMAVVVPVTTMVKWSTSRQWWTARSAASVTERTGTTTTTATATTFTETKLPTIVKIDIIDDL